MLLEAVLVAGIERVKRLPSSTLATVAPEGMPVPETCMPTETPVVSLTVTLRLPATVAPPERETSVFWKKSVLEAPVGL